MLCIIIHSSVHGGGDLGNHELGFGIIKKQ